ncbi:TetR/AcrR family transcriptional regulator [Bacillus xiapuensis]|uniref:TetR/AcrR family transcriptional regulator n=1 Tax=Bacillus xiapuensis TaxID=2014075 RepID=UPI000C248124|nr:TetR/AcrR family transcriptional regulator [Bacillus xiapuensis]
MTEKEITVIGAAIRLFAIKGFAATSIQEIADESGISKGAFYLHFKSKEALLYAVLQYYFEIIQSRLNEVEKQTLPPREKFTRQLTVLLESLCEHKEFIITQAREQTLPLNDDVKELLLRMRRESHVFYRNGLLACYGRKSLPFIWDLSLILEGILHSYIQVILADQECFSFDEVAQFIMRRMDSMAAGCLDDQPLLSKEKAAELEHKTKQLFMKDSRKVIKILKEMKKDVQTMPDKEALDISLDVMMEEAAKAQPRLPVIQGMLSNLKDTPDFDKHRREIADFYGISL